ncbi:MAG TPA: 2,3-diaminopropionate biosynthesis protein SbnB [Blastocatellia bacterium]|jgi:ornithine cyclodeaminase
MHSDDLLILKGNEIASLLANQELQIIRTVQAAYEAHAREASSLPHSTFLRFPGDQKRRIIALPAYLGEDFNVAGIKWVSSFPDNHDLGLERASAVMILNSMLTGRPQAILEGSIISARRTAALAALAARHLHEAKEETRLGIIGSGMISFEVARFVLAALPDIKSLIVFDTDAGRAKQFKKKCCLSFDNVDVEIAEDMAAIFGSTSLISIATTAVKPHIFSLSACAHGSTILHISLRDISPEAVLSCDNIVDDLDHVCRAETSVHLAEQMVGDRSFIRCTLADILMKTSPARRDTESVAVFSPFGLGILDVAVSSLVCQLARKRQMGQVIKSFLPDSWLQRSDGRKPF